VICFIIDLKTKKDCRSSLNFLFSEWRLV